jgi:hypothetical protein
MTNGAMTNGPMTNGSMTNDQWGNEPMTNEPMLERLLAATENGSEWRMKMAARLDWLSAMTEKVASGEW